MFGLKNASFVFVEMMTEMLRGCESFTVAFFDDVAIHSLEARQHLKDVEVVLRRFQTSGMTLNPRKCKFGAHSIDFLGHHVGNGLRSPQEAKVWGISQIPVPVTKKDIRVFLGMATYYRSYVPDFASL